jgi:hypothetical protein
MTPTGVETEFIKGNSVSDLRQPPVASAAETTLAGSPTCSRLKDTET